MDTDEKSTAALGLSPLLLLPISSVRSILLSVLSMGPIPRHIAFVMDGNRRWATWSGSSIRHGHLTGFATLKKILQVCLGLQGLETVTVYAFAIDNFKRNKAEVDALMDIAKTRLLELAGHGEVIARHQVRVRIVGRKELLPPDVLAAVEKVESMTSRNTKATLNICMPYASRDEMTGAVRKCVDRKLSKPDQEITPETLDSVMQLSHSPPLDILVRTSGVSRLSDFMLWQCTDQTQLHFVDEYWPRFGMRNMIPIILEWQRYQLSKRAQRWCGWSDQV